MSALPAGSPPSPLHPQDLFLASSSSAGTMATAYSTSICTLKSDIKFWPSSPLIKRPSSLSSLKCISEASDLKTSNFF
ncbi:hypothetical protein C4D60_Mb11t16730 [Musa balbisiana]|uniref:Uncharacterized protein n=1 Tax=Musa balbisiana TaxID=52838 RepID=A0A4S8J4L7_MUSBA|nr:hypothetical protein C4D60_Mb11t16730 [Musa balbisiana]